MKNPLVSVIVLNCNGKKYLSNCIKSIKNSKLKGGFEIIIADNGSIDGSPELVKKENPSVKIVYNKENLGFAEGNNRGAKHARGKYLLFLNNDTEVDKKWLSELVRVMEKDEKIAICTPKQLLEDKRTILFAGSAINYVGFSYTKGMYEKDRKEKETKEIPFASGAAFLIRKRVADKIGLFDNDYFIYHEDVDLSWRALLAGYKIIYVPTSVIYHFYKPSRNVNKLYLLEKNRFMTIIKNYSKKTLFLFLPMVLFSELLVCGYAVVNGWLSLKIRSYLYLIKNFRKILKKRCSVQRLRKVSDGNILKRFTYEINYGQEDRRMNKIATSIFKPYWNLVKKIIK